ncbi:hypothetical protein Snov_4356 [Ancylobacter novellus DSM 506]|uniref:Uncharacterized protein n=1 Tax=Ancylobacter novellus (strain ATCC 8093 / DSM 506 / JCM 20403 / CCM 1077 / IAM 12100 / NBRC 12443 / NCIMB 10456) TaxID=639283 RepID=D7A2T5_ANCN5|nr:hypothetical protein Snov_4356 [Ancylobacter novellus DSM 506]
MPFRNLELEPATIAKLDRCLARAQDVAVSYGIEANGAGLRTVLALALIEAANAGEEDEDQLVEFALRALPAYRRLGQASPP